MITTIKGNILSAPEEYIAHQCNCVTHTASGIAQAIFTKWSYSDCYSIRWENDIPGTIEVRCGHLPQHKNIINMFAQYNPGKPINPDCPHDGYQARKKYFVMCLMEIKKLKPKSVAFPVRIGCGLAGGDWNFYNLALEKFAQGEINVVLYDFQK